jgi:hypothetical protein
LNGVGVRCDELGLARTDLRAGFRIERAYQRNGGVEFFRIDVQHPAQARAVVAGERFEVVDDEFARHRPAGRRGIERIELRAQAFAQRAAGDAERIEVLDPVPDRLDFVDVDIVQRRQVLAQRLAALVQIAVVVDGLDDRGADRAVARGQRRQVQLPQQVVAQVLGFLVLRFEIIVVVRHRAAVVGAPEFEVDRIVAVEFVAALVVARLVVGAGGVEFVVDLGRWRLRRSNVFAVRFFFALGFGQFQQRVGLHRLAQLHLELDAGQLQQADRLLQLRRQCQLLMEAQL